MCSFEQIDCEMKRSHNRLQTLLSMVKHVTIRPLRGEDRPREPWELAPVPMEQMELQFDLGASRSRTESHPKSGDR